MGDPGFVVSRNFDSAPTVLTVEQGSEAERAGMREGDTIVEVDGKSNLGEVLASLRPEDTIRVRLRSRGRERELKFRAGARDVVHYALVDVEHPSDAQMKMRAEWLSTASDKSTPAAHFSSDPPFGKGTAPLSMGVVRP